MKHDDFWGDLNRWGRSLWLRLTQPSAALRDSALRRKSQVLAALLLVLFVLFGTLDLIYYLHPDYNITAQSIMGYLFLAAAYTLTRRGRYGLAATLTVTMFPLVLFSEVIGNNSNDPVVTLSFLVLSLLLSSILLSARGTAVIAGIVIVGIVLMPALAPEAIPDFASVLGPLAINGIGAALVLVAMIHRDQIERDRRRELSQINRKLRDQIDERHQIEQALRGSDERHRAIAEMISDYAFAYRVDPDGSFRNEWITDDAYHRITGYHQGGISDTLDLYHPDDQETVRRDVETVIAGEPSGGEYRIITKSGETRWVQLFRRPIWDAAQKRVIRFYGAARDITARKEAEEALRLSEDRYRVISEIGSDYAYSNRVNPDGTFENEWITEDAFHRITGYEIADIWPHIEDLYHPDDQERVRQDRARVFTGEEVSGEYRIITKNGETRWLQLLRRPVWDEGQTRVTRYYGAARDITGRKLAEEALRKSEDRYRAVSETVSDFAFSNRVNPDGTVVLDWVTGDAYYRITGYDYHETWDTMEKVYHPDDVEFMYRDIGKVIAGESTGGEYRIITKNGETRWLQITRQPVWDAERTRVIRYHGAARDITERKRAEEALRLNNFALESTSDAVYWVNVAEIVDVNAAACRMLGYSREEFQGMSVQTIDPAIKYGEIVEIGEHIKKEGSLTFESRHKTKEGRIIPVEIIANYIGFEGKELNCCFVRDITERKRAEEALRLSEERYRAISETVADYAFCHRVHADGTAENEWITEDPFYRITGYTREAAQPPAQWVHPDDRERMYQDYTRALAGEANSGNYRIFTKDGAQRWLQIDRQPVWDAEHKRVIRLYGAARDITERKQADEALRKSEERFQKAFHTSPDSVTISRLDDGRFIDVNPGFARLTGYSREEVIGRSSLEVQLWANPDLREQLAQELQKHGEAANLEGEFQRKDGSVAVALLSARAIEIDGEACLLSITRDITARRQAQQEREALIEELERKNAELERFTYTVSHDLKSPLITIQGFLGFLEQAARAGDMKQIEEDMSRITNAVGKMQQLMDELLELSRIGRLVNPPEEVPLGELARQAVDTVGGQLSENGIQVEIAADLPVVYGDKVRLREALENLLGNTTKFMGDQPDPRVTIGMRREGEERVFYVQDNGIGIDPRYHDTVFGLFNKLTSQSEGTGIGLAIVKRIIEVHGGRIWVESAGDGTGSTFCFTLPDREGHPQWKTSRQAASH